MNIYNKEWLSQLFTFLAEHSPKSEKEIINLIEDEAYMNEALLHVQFGNPEQILIVK